MRRMTRVAADWADGAAVCASAVCMVHCLALPLLIAALPALATRLDLGEGVHGAILAFAVPTSAWALIAGWRRHRTLAPLAFGASGLLLMAAGIVSREAFETALTVAGSLLLAGAHVANWRGRSAAKAAA